MNQPIHKTIYATHTDEEILSLARSINFKDALLEELFYRLEQRVTELEQLNTALTAAEAQLDRYQDTPL
jgi:hypothetical protein